MAPTHSIAFCNNRGGVGKTFMAFQVACEAARARPEKKVLVIDFSVYADISQLLLGGAAKGDDGAPKGLKEIIRLAPTMDTRIEGLVRDLEHAMDVDTPSAFASMFGMFANKKKADPPTTIDLTKYAIRPHDANKAIPDNLYLIPCAGKLSWGKEITSTGAENDVPLWNRKGDGWVPASRRLSAAVDALPEDFDAVFADTDHLASCVLTKMALAMCDSVVVPASLNTQDYERLFIDMTENALFTDVMVPMMQKSQLRAKVHRMVFTRVTSQQNHPVVTPGYIKSPFKPTAAAMSQMDILARHTLDACKNISNYKELFEGADAIGETYQAFNGEYFSAMKAMPDLAATFSVNNGLPLCTMTSQVYVSASGLTGNSADAVLNSIKGEMQALTMSITSDKVSKVSKYSKPPMLG
jgi:cellulose biosynthesis protein BcsQ